MKLFCVRHGETVYNAEGRIQGQNDSQLSPLSWRQCRAAAVELAAVPIDAIVASPLKRSADSASCIADALKLKVQFDDRLKELNAGVFQELRWDEIDTRFPAEAARWRSQDPDFRIPGGESRRDLMERAQAAFRDIREAGYRAAVVVAHGGSIGAAFKALLDIPPERSPFALANGSISVALWEKEFKLLSLNEIGHLRETVDGGEM